MRTISIDDIDVIGIREHRKKTRSFVDAQRASSQYKAVYEILRRSIRPTITINAICVNGFNSELVEVDSSILVQE